MEMPKAEGAAPNKSGVFWTQFPAEALTDMRGLPVDWSDHQAAHRAVSRLFPQRLPGEAGARRSAAGILYRRDLVSTSGDSVILVQSLVRPELTPELSRCTEVSAKAWNCNPEERVLFKVAVNPVTRTTRYFSDAQKLMPLSGSPAKMPTGQRDRSNARRTASVIPADAVGEWVAKHLGGALRELEIGSHFRDTTYSGKRMTRHKLVVDVVEGYATVEDSAALNRIRLGGFGRGKAYGCGLLTVARLRAGS